MIYLDMYVMMIICIGKKDPHHSTTFFQRGSDANRKC